MLTTVLALVPLGAMLLPACAPTPADLVDLSVADGGTVYIDTVCSTDCTGDTVSVAATFQESVMVDIDASIQLLQYKVEYVLDGVDTPVTYFADTTDQTISSGQTASFDIRMAAASQRALVSSLAGGQPVSGTATLTFAGYDWKDYVLTVEQQVPVVFDDYADASTSDTGVM